MPYILCTVASMTTLFPQSSCFAANYRVVIVLFLLPHLISNSFQSCASALFYLILQRARPLIYRVNIAWTLKHPTRNVDPAIIHGTALASPFHRIVLDRVANMQSTLSTGCLDISFFRTATLKLFYYTLNHEN